MKQNNFTLICVINFIFILISCECAIHEEKKYYLNGILKSVTKTNCQGQILVYDRYSIEGDLVFGLEYENNEPIQNIKGKAWIHIIHNKNMNEYIVGDTMVLSIDIADPPFLSRKLFVERNGDTVELLDNSKFYEKAIDDTTFIYQTVVDDTLENITLIGVYYYNSEKWSTVRRTQPYIISPTPDLRNGTTD